MSDSPEHPNSPQIDPQEPQVPQGPQDPQEQQEQQSPAEVEPTLTAAEPAPTSAVPEGLAPSPGIAPPVGMAAPELSQPEFAQPAFTQPEFTQPEFTQPEFTQPQFEQPQFAQPALTQPDTVAPHYTVPDAAASPVPEQPYGQVPAAEQPYGQDPAQQQFAQGQVTQYDQQQFGQQYSQDPATAQYAQAPGGPAGPGGPGGPGIPGAPKKGLSTGAIVGIVGGAVALVIILIVGSIFALGVFSAPSGSSTGATSSNSGGKGFKAPKTAEGTVELFLNSVATGDATTARKIAGGATSDELLTDEALANSLKIAPITNIVIDKDASQVADYEATVSATFDIGDTTVSRDFKLWNASDSWELFDGLVSVSLTSFDGLTPTVNGIELSKTSSISVFPGAYQLTLGLESFELDSKTDTFVLATRDDAEVFYEVRPQLTEAATEEYRTLVAASLNECLALKTFVTPCGLEVDAVLRGGEKVIDGTITRTISAEGEATLKRLKPEISYGTPAIVTTYDYVSVSTSAEVDNAGTRESGQLIGGGGLLRTPTVDFSEATPTVTWE